MPLVRRLAAILAADVVGYSRLMGADEEGTHERLKADLGELVNPKIADHRGRIVKNTGDGFLAEFASVVDAVRCAVEMQRGMVEREEGIPPERRIEFRVGINLGDVIAEPNDIYGDGVNVAARLEALAEPGGICISRVVREEVRDKLPYPFEDRGEQTVKNIARPVRVFVLRPETIAELPLTDVPIAVPRRRRSIVPQVTAGTMAALLVMAAIAWRVWPVAGTTPTPIAAVATSATTSVPQPLVAPRLSIVVLPFANLSNDPDQQYFADGITEDLTTDLSRLADMFVISRSSAFTYKDKPVNAKQIGRELGVRYVLEGSVQRSSSAVRVNAQLINAETAAHLWAERFDREMGDLFALQNDITNRIALAFHIELIAAEAVRPTEHPDALDYILQGRAARLKPNSRNVYAEVISLYERALALDPLSVEAQTRLAEVLADRALDGMSNSRTNDLARAEALVGEALAASPHTAAVHFAKGEILRAQGRFQEAIPEFETVLALDRSNAWALVALAHCKLRTGAIEEVISLVEQAIRLSPRDPNLGLMYFRIGEVHLLRSRPDEAITWLERARSANPEYSFVRVFLASAYGLSGQTKEANAEIAAARQLSGNGSPYSIARERAAVVAGFSPAIRPLLEATYVAGLRKAGVPEE
jgi:TolB-like protein/class 3 adenylate cyclase/Flp pilus assembly protein TadD